MLAMHAAPLHGRVSSQLCTQQHLLLLLLLLCLNHDMFCLSTSMHLQHPVNLLVTSG